MTRRQWVVAGFVLLAGLLLGVAQAVVWANLAPGVDYRRGADDAFYQLPTSSAHAFASVAIFTMVGMVIGAVGALAVWKIRAVRGPAGLAVTLIAALGSGFLAFVLAPEFVTDLDFGTPAGVTATAAPKLDTPLVAVVTAAVAALVYSLAVFLDGRPDLGASPTSVRPGPTAASVAPWDAGSGSGTSAAAGPGPAAASWPAPGTSSMPAPGSAWAAGPGYPPNVAPPSGSDPVTEPVDVSGAASPMSSRGPADPYA